MTAACPEVLSLGLPSNRAMQECFAKALNRMELWPAQLFDGLSDSNLLGRGLLVCAVHVHGKCESDVRLQVPVSTEPLLTSMIKSIQKDAGIVESNKQLRRHLPRKAGLAFQFVTTDAWKQRIEPRYCYRIPRRRLKETNLIVMIVCFVMSPAPLVQEIHLLRAGASMCKELAASLTDEDKEVLWERFVDENAVVNYVSL